MLQSMTAYASHSDDSPEGVLTWEIRTVNHRFLDVSVHLPEIFRDTEMAVRESVKSQLQRGKVDVSLKYQPADALSYELSCNEVLLGQLQQMAQRVSSHFPEATIDVFDVLNYRGVVQTAKQSTEQLSVLMFGSLQGCLERVVSVRGREGDGIAQFIQQRLEGLATQLAIVEQKLPVVMAAFKQRLLQQFEILQSKVDTDRLEQELVWFAQKIDIAEELQRLHAHVTECNRIISVGGVVGRRLDFLMQELNREANTIASKSVDIEITQAALEMKVLLEQIREQVQNIE